MAQTVSTVYEGYITIPVKVKNRSVDVLSLVSTRVTHKDGLPTASDPSWFAYTSTTVERVDGVKQLDVVYKFLSSATTSGTYTIEYVIRADDLEYTKTIDVVIPIISSGTTNPISVSDLVYWTSGDSLFGLPDGSAIGELPNLTVDLINNPESIQQLIADSKPSLKRNVADVDNRSVVQFDANDSVRLTHSFGSDKTVFLLFKTAVYGNILTGSSTLRPRIYSSQGTITSHKTGGVPIFTSYIGIENSSLDTNQGSVNTSVVPLNTTSDYYLVSAVFTSGYAAYWINGQFEGYTSGNGASTSYFDFLSTEGWVAEALFYDRELDDSEMAVVHGYLAARYPSLSITTEPFFSPTDITTCLAWYNNRSPLITINVENGNVAESYDILNATGYGGTLSRDEGTCSGVCVPPGSQPEYAALGLNNQGLYKFTDSEFLRSVAFTSGPTPGDNMTIFLVCGITGTITGSDEKYIFDGGSSGNRLALGYANSKLFLYRGTTLVQSADIAGLTSAYKIIRAEFNPATSNDELFVAGTRVIDADTGGDTLTDGLVLGSRYDAAYGNANTTKYGAGFNIPEMIVYNKILTVDEVLSVENYLAARYRLQVN